MRDINSSLTVLLISLPAAVVLSPSVAVLNEI